MFTPVKVVQVRNIKQQPNAAIIIWQDVIWIEKKGAEIQLLKKSMNMWFLCFWGFIMAVGNQIIQKNIKKLLSGYFLAYPPKMHYSAPQCSAMYCSVNASIIHSRWVKYDPWWPRMTDYGPGWHTRGQGGTRGSRGAPGHSGPRPQIRKIHWWNHAAVLSVWICPNLW